MAKSSKKESVKEETTKPSLNRLISEINRKAGANVIGRMSEMHDLQMARMPTGIDKLDSALGGGMPLGRIVELYGLPSGGKSLIAMLTIKRAQEQGLECVYLDAENSFDPAFAEKLGVDVKSLIIAQSSIGEDTLELVQKLLKAEPAIIVIDSVAAMVTRAEMEETLDKQFMAVKARLMSKALSILNASNKKTCLVFINQLRATMAMYGPQTTTPGGMALKFYSSIRIEVKKGEQIHEEDKKTNPVIGQIVNFNITKNKTAAPYRLGSFKFYYEDGKVVA